MNRTSTYSNTKGISAEYRDYLSKLHRNAKGPITVADTQKILNLPKEKIAKLLPYLASSGWLKRIRRGLYLLIPLEAKSPGSWTTNDWLVASKIFEPCYIGGWSAAHHWGFTDQLYNSIVVMTTHKVRKHEMRLAEFTFVIRTVKESRFFGLEKTWQGQNKISLSDPTRTIIDLLDTPRFGNGIRHTVEILEEYFSSNYFDEKKLIEYMKIFGNRAVAKRLGFLIETNHWRTSKSFLKECEIMVNRGIAYLDPDLPHKGEKNMKWNLMINATLS